MEFRPIRNECRAAGSGPCLGFDIGGQKAASVEPRDMKSVSPLDPSWLARQEADFRDASIAYAAVLARQDRVDTGPDGRRHFSPDVVAPGLTVSDGRRLTLPLADNSKDCRDVIVTGGSTVFCLEVCDRETLPSSLQYELDAGKTRYRVHNFGMSGATTANRVSELLSREDLGGVAAVVLYLGINDCALGYRYQRMRRSRRRTSSTTLEILRNLLRMLNYLRYETVPAIHRLESACRESDSGCLVVLQPHLRTYRPSRAAWRASRLVGPSFEDRLYLRVGYRYLWSRLHRQAGFLDFTSALDGESGVYVDYAHLTSRGNLIVARNLATKLERVLNTCRSPRDPRQQEPGTQGFRLAWRRRRPGPSSQDEPEAVDPLNYPLF